MRQIRIGKVVLTKGGKWNATTGYPILTYVLHNGDGWWSAKANINSEPSSSNANWIQATDVQSFITALKAATTEASEVNAAIQAAEEIRKSDEATREANEVTRQTNETTRINAEAIREANEAERQAKEQERQTKETERQETFARAITESETATNLADESASEANTQAAYAKTEGDYAKTEGDYAKEMGESVQPDHEQAVADHTTASSDHTTAESDHSTYAGDITKAESAATTASAAASQTAADVASLKNAIENLPDGQAVSAAVADLQAPAEISEGSGIAYIKVIGTDGLQHKITPDNFGKEEILHEAAWGVTIDPNTSSPALTMKGNAGMWEEYKEKIGRYLVTNDGKARKLMKTDSTKFVNGTTIDETTGQVMVKIPKLYYKSVTNSDGSTTLWMSEEPIGGHEIKEQWVGAYIGHVVSNAFVSRSGLNPTRSRTISEFWAAAQVNGTDWGLEDYEQRKVMIMLFLSEYLSLNSQGTLGNGMTGTGNNWCPVVLNALTGQTSSLGDNCGSVDFTTEGQSVSGACHVSLFGIEDPYGWFWEKIQGCYFGNSGNEAQTGTECFLYEGNRMPSADELTTHPTGDYRPLTRVISSNYLKAIIAGEYFDVLSKTLGGSATTYWCDYNYNNTTGQLLLWGGPASAGSNCGLAYSASDVARSDSLSDRAARLAYYGEITYLED